MSVNIRHYKSLFLLLLIFALSFGVVAGCGKSQNAASNQGDGKPSTSPSATANPNGSDKKVELRFGWWGSQVVNDKTLKIVEKFEQQHPNIKITPEYSAFAGYWDKLSTQVAGSNEPDVMKMSILYINEYTSRGVLADLKTFEGKEIKIDYLNQNVLKNQGTINGKLSGVPYADNASVLFINKDIYKQAGVEPPKNDMTWQEYFDKAREMKGKLGDKVYGASDMSQSYEAFMYYLFSIGDALYKDGKLGYDDQHLKDWLALWDKARKEGIVPPATKTASYILGSGDPTKDPIMKGDVPIIGPSWIGSFPAFESVLKDKIDMITYPRDKKLGSVLQTAMFFSASAKSKHPKEAAMLIDFLVNSPDTSEIMGTTMGIPENSQLRERLSAKYDEKDKKMNNVLEYVSKNDPSWYDVGPNGAGEISKLFEKTVQKQQFNQASIDDTVKEFRKEAEKILGKNK